jgi:leader peptidase (prepilin peptidase)/N-methyltransferase
MEWIAAACLIAAIGLLIGLSVIDLKVRLLPDKLVLPFALLGILFHITTKWQYLDVTGMLLGGLAGLGILYLIRMVANHIYKQDALGLGDVKLMGAAGLWLGFDMVMMALSVGAFAGLLHGIAVGLLSAYKTKTKPNFHCLQIPAGPGFAIGIVLVAVYMFQDFRPWE